MKDCVYSSLREETLQLFSAVRTLAMGEVGAMLAIVSAMLNVKDFLGAVALLFTASGLLVFTTTLGQHWFLQALRQSSYVFFAHEVPAFRQNAGLNMQDLWILASRSEGEFRKNNSAKEPGPHIHMGGDLERFIDQQFWLLGFAVLAAIVATCLHWPKSGPQGYEFLQDVLAGIIAVVTVAFLFVQRRAVSEYSRALARFWHAYLADRESNDCKYLKKVEAKE